MKRVNYDFIECVFRPQNCSNWV